MVDPLPDARAAERYLITVVCSGNICRSPTADVVLNDLVARAGLADRVAVDSAGLGGWHVGDPMDPRSAACLTAAGYDPTRHRARQLDLDWTARYDLVLAMDHGHLRDLRAQARRDPAAEPARIRLFRDFDPVGPGGEVPDPYYGGHDAFEEVLTMVERTGRAIVAALRADRERR